MDPMVIKYLGLAGVVYGLHAYLALAQIALATFFVVSGILILVRKQELKDWIRRLGFVPDDGLQQNALAGWMMILTGISLVLPIAFGLPHWLILIACPFAIYWLIGLSRRVKEYGISQVGSLARKVLILSSIAIICFTGWEERDLIGASYDITSKAAYWRHLEVDSWQVDNNPNVPKIGEIPPDFELTDVHGESTVKLSDFRGRKPVVLLFGSFT